MLISANRSKFYLITLFWGYTVQIHDRAVFLDLISEAADPLGNILCNCACEVEVDFAYYTIFQQSIKLCCENLGVGGEAGAPPVVTPLYLGHNISHVSF